MRLYHSSNTDFEVIDLSRSKPNKDFGRAFYIFICTEPEIGLWLNNGGFNATLGIAYTF